MSPAIQNASQFDGFSLRDLPPVPRQKFVRKPLSQKEWRELRIARTAAAKKQLEGIESTEIFKLTIEAKLAPLQISAPWWTNFQRCGREMIYAMCDNCRATREIPYQCSQKICPRCNWRIADNRRKLLEKITAGMTGCKHLVVTQKNFNTNLREKIRESRANLLKLRRQSIMGKVTGGCASLEITNESCGWHPHWHMLIQSPFISAKLLSQKWGELVGQEFAIVKIKDVDERSYLAELCKYAASGAEIAKWDAATILEFVEAVRGTRMFTVFGKFKEVRSFAAMAVAAEKPPAKGCDCGCDIAFFGDSPAMCQRIWNRDKGLD